MKYAKGAKGGMLSYCLKTKVKGGQEDLGVSPPLEKGAGGISFHTVAWLHLFALFAYFVVPLSLKAFSLQPSVYLIYLSSYKRASPCRVYPVR